LLHQDTADSLPADITDFLDGTGLASKIGETVQLTAVDDAGWPRMTLLSAGEVVAPHSRELRFLLRHDSRTARALTSNGHCQLILVIAQTLVKAYLTASQLGTVALNGREYRLFRATVVTVERDAVDYAGVTSGITYRLPCPEPVLRRWTTQVELLISGGLEP
jgi:hypothetical protein